MTGALAEQSRAPELVRVVRESAGTRPAVRIVRHGSGLAVVKDFRSANGVLRALGLALIPREREAYQRLAGLPGIPRWLGQPDRYSMALEYVEGVPVNEAEPALLTPVFFERLRAVIKAMHGRGVAHCDLKRLENILVGADGWPIIIDFSSAFFTGSNPAEVFLMPYLMDEDLRAIGKIKLRRAPHLLTLQEAQFMAQLPAGQMTVRRMTRGIRALVKHLAHREHKRIQ